ncbi:OmpA family protein [Amycolatopsis sp. NPDC101161]|uniref:OmpA family protein n=1 Tax=Amycolatopsis sp. NPDC101161 TaxID=3363940 RepID=UPI00380FC87D
MYADEEENVLRQRRSLTKSARIMLFFAGAVAAFVALLIVLVQCQTPTKSTNIVWLAEKTDHAPGAIPRAVRDRIRTIGAEGGGRLSAYAVGERAISVADAVGLDLDRGNGKVADTRQQASNVDHVLKDVAGKLEKVPVSKTGFSLYAALQAAADEAERAGNAEVWLTTTVLTGSTEPLTISKLSAGAEPAQAVDELMKTPLRDLNLSNVDLHVVLLTPVGEDQLPLDPRSESWRAKFIQSLGSRLGATVADPVHDNSTSDAWPNSARVPPITPFSSPPPSPSLQPRIDNAAFAPDSAELIDRPAATAAAVQVTQQYRANNGHSRISVTGYCAKYGDAAGARKTSADRAEAIAALLREQGIPPGDIDAAGVGFDQLATPGQDATSAAQRVVVIKLIARP